MNIVSHGPTDGVFEIEIDRPEKKNALTETMYRDLTSALVTAEQDPQTRVVLIYGQPFCFTAGNDLQDFFDNPPTSDNAPVFVFLLAMASLTKTIVCAINGAAVGIGTTLCCHADLVYCGDTVKFRAINKPRGFHRRICKNDLEFADFALRALHAGDEHDI